MAQLRKMRQLTWKDASGQPTSRAWRFDTVVEEVCRTCDFEPKDMGLPSAGSRTLTSDFSYAHDVPAMADAAGPFRVKAVGSLGASFPLIPTLDREGGIFTSFEDVLQQSVVESHARLVDSSDAMLHPPWVNNLRILINDVVSSVDIALNYLYLLAEHNPKLGWRFDRTQLGVRHGRKMEDKLGWVEKITGRPLNARDERAAFRTLRELRNHLNHFDPPCFAYTIEDAACWLNLVPEVGLLLWEMRKCIGEPLPRGLVRWLMLRPVNFSPKDSARPRPPQLPTAGYASTRVAYRKDDVEVEEGWSEGTVVFHDGTRRHGWIRERDGLGVVYGPNGTPYGFDRSSGWLVINKDGTLRESHFQEGIKVDRKAPPLWLLNAGE